MTTEGFIASGAIPWLAFFSFSVALGYSASSVGLSKEVGTLTELSLLTSLTSEVVSVLEPEGIDFQMTEG